MAQRLILSTLRDQGDALVGAAQIVIGFGLVPGGAQGKCMYQRIFDARKRPGLSQGNRLPRALQRRLGAAQHQVQVG